MRKWYLGLVGASLIALVGCNTSTTGGGGGTHVTTGRTITGEKTTKTVPDNPKATFKLKGPENITAHTVKHDSSETFKVSVDKGKEFKEDLPFSVTVEPTDKGVTADVKPATLKASEPADVNVVVKVSDKAPDGKYKVTVTATPHEGTPASLYWEVKVPEKK